MFFIFFFSLPPGHWKSVRSFKNNLKARGQSKPSERPYLTVVMAASVVRESQGPTCTRRLCRPWPHWAGAAQFHLTTCSQLSVGALVSRPAWPTVWWICWSPAGAARDLSCDVAPHLCAEWTLSVSWNLVSSPVSCSVAFYSCLKLVHGSWTWLVHYLGLLVHPLTGTWLLISLARPGCHVHLHLGTVGFAAPQQGNCAEDIQYFTGSIDFVSSSLISPHQEWGCEGFVERLIFKDAQGFHKTFLLKSQGFFNIFSPLSFLPFPIALYFLIRTLCVIILCQNSHIINLLDKKKTVFEYLNKNLKVYASTCACIYIYPRNMYRT